jgi:preprotein translocase subunit Sec63
MASNTESVPNETKTGASNSQNYYDLLGITPQATDEEIKRAYRKTALRLREFTD